MEYTATNDNLWMVCRAGLRSTQVLYIGRSIPGYKYAKAGGPMTVSFLISLIRWFRHRCLPFDRLRTPLNHR
jgi:hypothetical protein